MTGLRLVTHQVRYDLKTFWRNPAAVFFTVLLPLVFLFIFATVFGNDRLPERGGIKMSAYYVPGIIALGLVSATFVNLSMAVTIMREAGTLKRLRGTPLPTWVFITGRVVTAVVVTALLSTTITLIGWAVYGVALPTNTLPGLIATLLIAAAAFCALGMALTAVIPSEQAAPAVTNAIVLPLYFISGIFFSVDQAPQWLTTVAEVFPVKHLAESLLTVFNPATTGAGFEWFDLAVVAIWGVLGLLAALKWFRWTPSA